MRSGKERVAADAAVVYPRRGTKEHEEGIMEASRYLEARMEKEFFPPLPDPAENQPPEARRVMGERLIKQARHELDAADRLQAGEKAWGAVVQFLKIIGERRGWGHTSNRQLQSLGSHLAAEYPEHGAQLATALSNAYHKGHENFYENRRRRREVREAVEGIEEVLPVLEILTWEAPRPFTIESNSQLRRLKVLTGNDELQVGDEFRGGVFFAGCFGKLSCWPVLTVAALGTPSP